MTVMSSGRPLVILKRRNDKRAGQVGAEDGEEEEFALGIYVRALGEIVAQVAFGQKVGEEDRNPASHGTEVRYEPAGAALEGEAQRRTLGIVDVVLLERKKLSVAREAVDNADLLSVQAHRKRLDFLRVKLHRAAPASCRSRGRRHIGIVPLLRPPGPYGCAGRATGGPAPGFGDR